MPPAPQTTIPLSKAKLTKLLVYSLLFVAGSAVLIFPLPHSPHPLMLQVIGVVGTLIGLYAAGIFIRKMRDTNPGLVIDDTGFEDNTSDNAAGFIRWSDVEAITTHSTYRRRFLGVVLKDPEAFLSGQPSSLKRKAITFNHQKFGASIMIAPTALQCSFDDLHDLFETHLARSRS